LNFLVLNDSLSPSKELKEEEGLLHQLVGAKGVALTPLRPSGTARINEKRVDVTTEGDFIESGEPIHVTQIKGSHIIVSPDSK